MPVINQISTLGALEQGGSQAHEIGDPPSRHLLPEGWRLIDGFCEFSLRDAILYSCFDKDLLPAERRVTKLPGHALCKDFAATERSPGYTDHRHDAPPVEIRLLFAPQPSRQTGSPPGVEGALMHFALHWDPLDLRLRGV